MMVKQRTANSSLAKGGLTCFVETFVLKQTFVFRMDFEKVPDVAWSGINTKAGQILIVKVQGGSGITGNIANSMFSTLVTQVVLEIRDVGCNLYD